MKKNLNLIPDVHSIQGKILCTLLFQKEARFSQLNINKVSTDHFNFHLKRLVEVGLVEKNGNTKYSLTAIGREFANRFDTEKAVIEKQAKISVVVCGAKKKNRLNQFLVQQRLKQPYFGFYGFVSGKIKWSETVLDAAAREFKEETCLEAKLSLAGIEHKMDYSKEGNLLEDKFFFIIKATDISGRLKESFEGGRNLWLIRNKIIKFPKLFGDVKAILKILEGQRLVFFEKKYRVSDY